MRKMLLASALLGLSACAPQLVPNGPPSNAQIAAEMASLRALNLSPSDIKEFYKTGVYLTQDNCGGYYGDAVMASIKSAETSGEAGLLVGLATGLMGIAGASGAATGAAGIGGSFISNMLLNQQTNSLAGIDPAGSYVGSVAEMAAMQNATPTPITAADAVAAIHNLARVCSPAGIKAMQEQALHSIPAHISVVGGQSHSVPEPSTGQRKRGKERVPPVQTPEQAPPYVIVR